MTPILKYFIKNIKNDYGNNYFISCINSAIFFQSYSQSYEKLIAKNKLK